jgi:flagellar protein FlaG
MLVEPITAPRSQINVAAAVQPKTKGGVPSRSSGSGLSPGRKHEAAGGNRVDAGILQDMLDVAQKHFNARNIGLEFSVHGETGRIKVKVLDKDTGEMIREVPPRQVLDLMAKIDEMMGIVFDQKA